MWKFLKNIVKRKEKAITSISFNGTMEADHQTIVDKFNLYFIESILQINIL
jgi:hypothetical protein